MRRRFVVECNVKAFGDNLKFWTFTFKQCTTPDECSRAWNHFLTLIRKEWPEAQAVRVFELHPGGHGMHVHLATPAWLAVRRMLGLAKRAGFGRIGVVLWKEDKLTAGQYLAKYLTKERPPCLKGRRLVGYINMPDRTRYDDIETTGIVADMWKALARLSCWRDFTWPEKTRLANEVLWKWVSRGGDEVEALPPGGPAAGAAELYLVILQTIPRARPDELFQTSNFARRMEVRAATAKAERSKQWMRQHIWNHCAPTIEQEIENECYEYERDCNNVGISREYLPF